MNEDMELRLTYLPPRGETKTVAFRVGREQFEEAFGPLPRDRELACMPGPAGAYFRDEAVRAAMMQEKRRKLAAYIAENLAVRIMEFVASQDPQFGYSPEEWAEITQQPPP